MNKTKLGSKNLLPILFILLIVGIGVQTLISCSSDDGGGTSDGDNSSSSVGDNSSSSGDVGDNSSSSVGGDSSSSSDDGGNSSSSVGEDPSLSSSSNAVIGTSSSSSAVLSSSSTLPSSSSALLSSGSNGGSCAGFVDGTEREHYGKVKKQFCDVRDGQKYVYVTIGEQIWIAENLNYNVPSSRCYGDDPSNCDTYGRLYDWATAKTVCPSGWHLPSQAEWDVMTAYIGGVNTEGKKLKVTSGWSSNGNGTDDYGFSALPGGSGRSGGNFNGVGNFGHWYSASEDDSGNAYRRHYSSGEGAYWAVSDKSYLFSVRCLQDYSAVPSSSSTTPSSSSVAQSNSSSSIVNPSSSSSSDDGSTEPPSTPNNVTATANLTSTIIVSWSPVAGATGYRVYRSTTATGTYTQVGISTTTSYINTGLSANTTYYYKVAASNNAGISSQSDYASAKTATTLLSVTATGTSGNSITVSWDAVADATGYYIYRSTTATGTYTQVGSSTTTSYLSTGLSASTTYYYKVAAYNSEGTDTQSNYAFATTLSTQCDNQTFETVKIGTQTWMKKNLNCDVSGSKCYANNTANCDTYGRLYDWATAMNLPSICNSDPCSNQIQIPHKGICPSGWHIPSNADWDILYHYADGTSGISSPYDSPTAVGYLKASSGWSYGNGEDFFGFSALPGGSGTQHGRFNGVGYGGRWRSASENSSNYNCDYYREMGSITEGIDDRSEYKSSFMSVRCVKDD